MSLLDLKVDRHASQDLDMLPERSKHLEHHDLLVDVLREELEDTVRELRLLETSPELRPR